MSIGIATSRGEDLDCDELFRRADAALYRAKGSGRDASVLWEPPLPASTASRLVTRCLRGVPEAEGVDCVVP